MADYITMLPIVDGDFDTWGDKLNTIIEDLRGKALNKESTTDEVITTILKDGDGNLYVKTNTSMSEFDDFDTSVEANSNVLDAYTHSELTTGNPHNVDADEVGKDTAQWNADKLKGKEINDTGIEDGKLLAYDEDSDSIVYTFSGVTGEVNVAENVGDGEGESFKDKDGISLRFRTIKAGTGISITN